jgi:hypothetical protein
MKLISRIAALLAITNVTGLAQINYETAWKEKNVTAVRITERITLDGHLEESAWSQAIPATDFTQWSRPGVPATNKTEAKFLYDDDNLYVAVNCWDKDIEKRVVNELREDFGFRDTDGVSVLIDSLHDRQSAFAFGTNPAGARRDQQIFNDGAVFNSDWDGVWDVKVSVDERGWIAEFRIPFKTLRFSSAPVQEWGLNISRRALFLSEEDMWAPVPLRYSCCTRPSHMGTLRGIENIKPGRNFGIKPFVTAGVTDVRATGQSSMQRVRSLGRIKDYDGGVDAKYGVTESLTLDLTYHTDFAQVEADTQQVNLTRFNLFFPEKREFFLENSGIFNVGPGGNLLPFFSRRIGLSTSGMPIPIAGGARLTGKAGAYDVGLLLMKTESVDTATVKTPSNNYFVGRLRRNVLARSYVGMLMTNRDSSAAGDYNRVYGADAHFVLRNNFELDSYLLRSDTPGKTGKNQARRFQTGWREDEWSISAQYNAVQTNFNPELGFIRRRDNSQYSGDAVWRPLVRSNDTIRNFNFAGGLDYFKGGFGKVETRTQDASVGIDFRDASAVSFQVIRTFDRLVSPTRIQGLPLQPGDYDYTAYIGKFNTDQSEKISGSGSIDWGEFWNGRRKSLTGGLALKPVYRFSATFNYTRNLVKFPAGESTTDLVGARFIYGFSPKSFINAFLQYNSETHEVSTNIRYNITYRPLSDIYLVYNDRRSTLGNELLERAFIVKVTNLFNF